MISNLRPSSVGTLLIPFPMFPVHYTVFLLREWCKSINQDRTADCSRFCMVTNPNCEGVCTTEKSVSPEKTAEFFLLTALFVQFELQTKLHVDYVFVKITPFPRYDINCTSILQ